MVAFLRLLGRAGRIVHCKRHLNIERRSWRSTATSALAGAAQEISSTCLAACIADESYSGTSVRFPEAFSGSGDEFDAVHQQSSMVANWPTHPLTHPEQLDLAKALVAALPAAGLPPARRGLALCAAYERLLEGGLFGVRSDGVARCGLVVVVDESLVAAAVSEACALLLRGHAVSLAAPRGQALGALEAVCAELPPQLVQAVELAGESVDLPEGVRAIRHIGGPAPQILWSHAPPQDFGGISGDDAGAHGMLASAGALAMARTDMSRLPHLPRARFELSDEASDLLSLLSTELRSDVEFPQGTQRPRWAQSAYDRGVEEVHDLLDLLWAFREPWATNAGDDLVTAAALVAAPKHFILPSGGTAIPDELVKAAAIAAMSPFREPVTVHAIALGAGGLTKDPLRSFCRLVQSGKSGLEWNIMEHNSREDFVLWLRNLAQESGSNLQNAPAVFGAVHSMEDDVWRLSAAAGGVQWGRLFTAEPLEQLRRWTRPVTKVVQPALVQDLSKNFSDFLRPISSPSMELVLPLPQDDD